MTSPHPMSGLSSTRTRLREMLPLVFLTAGTGFASVFLTLRIMAHVDQPVFIWPVSGAIVAVLLPYASQHPKGKFVLYLSGAAGSFAGGMAVGMSWSFAAIITALVCIDLWITGLLLVPNISTFDDLKQESNLFRFVLATLLSPTLTGFLGAFSVARLLRLPRFDVAFTSASADAIGIALAIPAILLLRRRRQPNAVPSAPQGRRHFLFVTLFLVVSIAVFWQNRGPFLFAIFPPMVLMVLEIGLEGAVFAALALSGIGWFATTHGHGPICLARGASFEGRLLALQFFVWVSITTALPVGAILNERKKAERNSRKADSIHDVLIKHSTEVIVLSSIDGISRHVSPAIHALTGWTVEEYTSQDRFLTVHPDDRENARVMISGLTDGVVRRFRYRILQKNGGWKCVDATVCPYGDGAVDGYVGTIRDISDFVESEENWDVERRRFSEEQQRLAQVEQATQLQLKLKDEFLSNVSHELRSPLTSIYSFATIIDDGLAGDLTPEQKQYLSIVLKNVLQLQSMIEDLLTVTQSTEGKLAIQTRPMSMKEAVVDTVHNFEAIASAKKISLGWTDGSRVGQVMADPVRVRQVLTILVDNALKFTPENGRIDVDLREISAGLVLTRIKDTGCGIPRDKWTKVFDKLYQVTHCSHSDTSKEGRNGLGLGLHIARTLVARQGGQIWVTSLPNEGSIFHFTLPVFRERRNENALDSSTILEGTLS